MCFSLCYSYRQQYSQSNVSQEGSIKLAPFGGPSSGMSSNTQSVPNPGSGPPAPEYHEYGGYPPRPRMPQPPHAPLHPPHHVHPSHYPGYHPGPDPMYSVPEQPGRLGKSLFFTHSIHTLNIKKLRSRYYSKPETNFINYWCWQKWLLLWDFWFQILGIWMGHVGSQQK